MTFFRDIMSAPFERHTVMIIGSISGVRPTATERENSNATAQLWSRKPTMRNTAETMTTMNRIITM